MNIYEVVFWGSHGNPNDLDTIYLVRAPDYLSAVDFVQRNASPRNHNGVQYPIPNVVYELGIDLCPFPKSDPELLRGPYFGSAYNRGWKSWSRKDGPESAEEEKIWDEHPAPE